MRLLTAAFLLRGIFYALALPYGDPLDEPFHLGYATFVAQTGRAPRAAELSLSAEVLRPIGILPRSTSFPGRRVTWREWALLPAAERSERRRQAFAWKEGDPTALLTPNYEAQQAPLTYFAVWPALRLLAGAPLWERLLALRFFAVLLSACAVPLALGFFRRVLPKRAAVAATAAFVAFPGLGLFAGRFTNDALALPIVVAILTILADMARGRLSWTRAVALGLLLAAGCWTKLYVLLLLPAAPLIALLFRRARRGPIFRRAVAASAFAFLAVIPWLARQHSDAGDWLGLTETKEASRLSIGARDRLESLPEIATLRFGVVFARTFLWPGTWSASGAPAGVAVVLSLALLAVAVPSGHRVASPRRAAGLCAGLCIGLFLVGHMARDMTYAAVARAKGTAIMAGPDGWYLLVLLPAILAIGTAWGRGAPPRRWAGTALIFLAADWWLSMGVLPAVYAGWTEFNGANAPFSAYGPLLAAPWRAASVFSSVGLGGVGAAALEALLAFWLLAFVLGWNGIRASRA